METIQMIQKAAAMGNWWSAISSRQCAHSCITSCAEFFGETSNHPGDSVSLWPTFGALRRQALPKTKITFEREEISDPQWDSVKHDGAPDGNCNKGFCRMFEQWKRYRETVWGPKVPTMKRTEASLSCVQCFLYLLQLMSLFFHITWLDTFWTDLVH